MRSIVDAYGPEEQAMGWYYYLENSIHFPFQAKCIVPKVVSPLRTGEIVEVLKLAPENACTGDMLVLIRWQGRNLAVRFLSSHLWPRGSRPDKPLLTGITGFRKATGSETIRSCDPHCSDSCQAVFIGVHRTFNYP